MFESNGKSLSARLVAFLIITGYDCNSVIGNIEFNYDFSRPNGHEILSFVQSFGLINAHQQAKRLTEAVSSNYRPVKMILTVLTL